MKKRVYKIAFSVAAAMLIGCGGGGGGSSSSTGTVSGSVIDGPIAYAKVCVDTNFDKICNDNEPQATTDINGKFTLKDVNLTAKAPILVEPVSGKTFDTVTKKEFNKKLAAPLDGSKVNVNPITTLVGAKLYELKKENNLTDEAVEKIKETVAKAVGMDPKELTSADITKDPKVYAIAVTLASAVDDIDDIDKVVDFDKLKEGNLTEAVKDPVIKEVLETVEKKDLKASDPSHIQLAIQDAIKKQDPSLLEQVNLDELALENLLVNNNWYIASEEGDLIVFEEDGNFIDYSDGEEYGTWEVNDKGEIILKYGNGEVIKITSITQQNPYMYNVILTDKNGTYHETLLSIPKGEDLRELPGISFINKKMLENKFIDLGDEKIIFYADGTYEERNNEGSAKGTWSIKDGELVIEGTNVDDNKSFTAQAVLFDNSFITLINEEGKKKGFIIPAKLQDLSAGSVNGNNGNTGFTPEMVADKSFGINTEEIIVFKKDGSWVLYSEGEEDDKGTWKIDSQGHLILHSTEENKDYVITLKENLDQVIVYELNGQTIYAAVLNTTNPYVSVSSSDDLKSINSLVGLKTFTKEMVEGKTFLVHGGDRITFKNDGTFIDTWEEDGDTYTATGTWEIDSNGVLVMNYDQNNAPEDTPDTVYVALGVAEADAYKVIVFIVKDGKLISVFPDKVIVSGSTNDGNVTTGFTKEMVANKSFGIDYEDVLVIKDDGTWVLYNDTEEDDKGTWKIDSQGHLALHSTNENKDYLLTLKQNMGPVIEYELNGQIKYAVVLNTDNPFISVSSSNDLKSITGVIGIKSFTKEMIEGKTFEADEGEKLTFNSNGTFTDEWEDDEGENHVSTGTWEIDSNGVLVMNFDPSSDEIPDTVYVALVNSTQNKMLVSIFVVKNGKLLFVTPDELVIQ